MPDLFPGMSVDGEWLLSAAAAGIHIVDTAAPSRRGEEARQGLYARIVRVRPYEVTIAYFRETVAANKKEEQD